MGNMYNLCKKNIKMNFFLFTFIKNHVILNYIGEYGKG